MDLQPYAAQQLHAGTESPRKPRQLCSNSRKMKYMLGKIAYLFPIRPLSRGFVSRLSREKHN